MSTCYRPLKPISNKELRDALPEMGLKIGKQQQSTRPHAHWSIFDGHATLWVYPEEEGLMFERFGPNDISNILDLVERRFQTQIVSEHEDAFWPEGEDDS